MVSDFKETIKQQSEISSNTGRQIGFGLFAGTWALSYYEGDVHFDILLAASFLVVIVYFAIDFYQYFKTTIDLRKAKVNYENAVCKIEKRQIPRYELEGVQVRLKDKVKYINKRSFLLFKAKFYVLPFSMLFILIYLVKRCFFV